MLTSLTSPQLPNQLCRGSLKGINFSSSILTLRYMALTGQRENQRGESTNANAAPVSDIIHSPMVCSSYPASGGLWEWWPGWHSVSTTTLTTTTTAAAVAVAVMIGRLHTGDTVTRVIFASSCIWFLQVWVCGIYSFDDIQQSHHSQAGATLLKARNKNIHHRQTAEIVTI